MSVRKLLPVLALITITAMAALACALANRVVERVAGGDGDGIQLPGPAGEKGQNGAGNGQADGNEPQESGSFTRIGAGLERIDRFRMTFSLAVDGQDEAGRPVRGQLEISQEVDHLEFAQHIRISGTGNIIQVMADIPTEGMEIYYLGDETFVYTPAGDNAGCLGMSKEDPSQPAPTVATPDDLIGGVENARLVSQGVEIQGIQTDHYRFDHSGLSFGAFTRAEGEYWVAQEGEFVLALHGEGQGSSDVFGRPVAGWYTWDYQVSDINQSFAIELPAECAAQRPPADVPVPESAQNVGGFAGMLTYFSAESPQAIVEFYRTALMQDGWIASEAADMETIFILNYSKENRHLNIMVAQEGEGTTVVITEERTE